MFLLLLLIAVGIGYVAFRLSAGLKHRTLWFFIFSGLIAFGLGFLFRALFLI